MGMRNNVRPSVSQNNAQVGFDTALGEFLSIKGDVVTSANMRIAGRIDGNVISEQTVVVDATGVVVGNISSVDKVIIGGHVTGDIEANHVVLQSTCRLVGTIKYTTIAVDTGAWYEGAVSQQPPRESISAVLPTD